MSHTPAPWHAVNRENPDRSYVVTAHQYGVAMEVHGANPEQRKANARLIAAAPAMHETLALAIAALDRDGELSANLIAVGNILNVYGRACIRKAEGET